MNWVIVYLILIFFVFSEIIVLSMLLIINCDIKYFLIFFGLCILFEKIGSFYLFIIVIKKLRLIII